MNGFKKGLDLMKISDQYERNKVSESDNEKAWHKINDTTWEKYNIVLQSKEVDVSWVIGSKPITLSIVKPEFIYNGGGNAYNISTHTINLKASMGITAGLGKYFHEANHASQTFLISNIARLEQMEVSPQFIEQLKYLALSQSYMHEYDENGNILEMVTNLNGWYIRPEDSMRGYSLNPVEQDSRENVEVLYKKLMEKYER